MICLYCGYFLLLRVDSLVDTQFFYELLQLQGHSFERKENIKTSLKCIKLIDSKFII
jgi:hypothetical protein